MRKFLSELVELTGQTNRRHTAPVLELLLGEVITRTTLSSNGETPCLSIIALLPRSEKLSHLPSAAMQPVSSQGKTELLWHADEGRYVFSRTIPIAEFSDEASVLDAILDTSDEATTWFETVYESDSGRC
ncbi:hypothetical protein EGT07_13470 [Herbaspirillum sp. HC18]|nr:hypothetical protein EGT07_13470 [Herbaspirillum sp. HC18]